jgi:hypothetical protein
MVDNIKMDITKVRLEGVNWIYLAQDRAWWWAVCEHGNETSGFIKAADETPVGWYEGLCSLELVSQLVLAHVGICIQATIYPRM